MSLVSFQEMLADAMKRHYAVPMFDVSNSTMMGDKMRMFKSEGRY